MMIDSFRLGFIALLLATAPLRAEESVDRLPFPIQAHRGGGIALPENTMETFRWSWEKQVTPEADLRTTKDGEIVCFHDANFKRVVRGGTLEAGAGIESLPLSEIEKLDVGSFRGSKFGDQRVPTLASVFKEMHSHPERQLYVDVKSVDLDRLAELVKAHGVTRQVIFTTSDHALIRDWKKRVPESQTLSWNGGTPEQIAKKIERLRKTDFDGITHLQVHVRVDDAASEESFLPGSKFLKSLGEELQGRGIVFQVLPWECSNQRAYERLLALGVDSFATDYPEVTLAAVRTYREKQQTKAAK